MSNLNMRDFSNLFSFTVLSLFLIFMVHKFISYIYEYYTPKKNKNIFDVQVKKYRELMNECNASKIEHDENANNDIKNEKIDMEAELNDYINKLI